MEVIRTRIPQHFLKFGDEALMAMAQMVSPEISFKQLGIAESWKPQPLEIKECWQYENQSSPEMWKVEIVPETCRPRALIDGESWDVVVQRKYKCEVGQLIPYSRWFMDCTEKLGHWPTEEEYLQFLTDRKRCVQLPANVEARVRAEFANFADVMRDLEAAQAIERFRKSVKKDGRK